MRLFPFLYVKSIWNARIISQIFRSLSRKNKKRRPNRKRFLSAVALTQKFLNVRTNIAVSIYKSHPFSETSVMTILRAIIVVRKMNLRTRVFFETREAIVSQDKVHSEKRFTRLYSDLLNYSAEKWWATNKQTNKQNICSTFVQLIPSQRTKTKLPNVFLFLQLL